MLTYDASRAFLENPDTTLAGFDDYFGSLPAVPALYYEMSGDLANDTIVSNPLKQTTTKPTEHRLFVPSVTS